MKRITVGLDLAKSTFHVVAFDQHGKQRLRKQLKRHQVAGWFARMEPSLVGIEACSGAHYWARRLMHQGHTVKLLAPHHVKAYARRQKNDFNDAAAIAEAENLEQKGEMSSGGTKKLRYATRKLTRKPAQQETDN